MGYLDNIGLAHFWEKIKTALSVKVDKTEIQDIKNTSSSPVESGKVWKSTSTGAEWGEVINGSKVYFQDGEPAEAKSGDFWLDTDAATTEGAVQDIVEDVGDLETALSTHEANTTDAHGIDVVKSHLNQHTGNTGIHVTADEKSAWNGKQNQLTAGDNITIVNNVISATGGSVEREWVLKGTISGNADDRGNIDTGVAVDLSGCTEVCIRSNVVATANISFRCNGTKEIIYSIGGNGTRTAVALLENIMDCACCTQFFYTASGYALSAGSTNMRARSDINISQITSFLFNNPSYVTSCDIKIYAR